MKLRIPRRARSWRAFQQRANRFFGAPITVETLDVNPFVPTGAKESVEIMGQRVQLIRITAHIEHKYHATPLRHEIAVGPMFVIGEDDDTEYSTLRKLLTAEAVRGEVYRSLLGQKVTLLIEGAPARDNLTEELHKRAEFLGAEPFEFDLHG